MTVLSFLEELKLEHLLDVFEKEQVVLLVCVPVCFIIFPDHYGHLVRNDRRRLTIHWYYSVWSATQDSQENQGGGTRNQ